MDVSEGVADNFWCPCCYLTLDFRIDASMYDATALFLFKLSLCRSDLSIHLTSCTLWAITCWLSKTGVIPTTFKNLDALVFSHSQRAFLLELVTPRHTTSTCCQFNEERQGVRMGQRRDHTGIDLSGLNESRNG